MDIGFAFPNAWLPLVAGAALFGLVLVALWLRRLEKFREGRLHRFVEAKLAPRLLFGYEARLRRPLFWLTLLGCAFLAVALMQPRWGRTWVSVDRASRDVLVLLDTSESMNAENSSPSRLVRARQKVEQLLARCPGDRFGLIAFSGDAALQCPLTLDHGYFRSILNAVDTDTMTEEGTDIEAALRAAEKLFKEEGASALEQRQYSRAIVLLSDGEEVSGNALAAAKDIAAFGSIHVVGLGDEQGAEVRYPEWMKQWASVPNVNQPHVTRLHEDVLSKVAVEGNGVYVRSTADTRDVDALFTELEALHARATSSDLRFNMVNRYRWPLSAAFACFLLEGLWLVLLPYIRRWRMARLNARPAAAALLCAAVLLAAPARADAFHDRLSAANGLLSQGLFDQAVAELEELKVDYPDKPVLDYALGSAHYQRAEGLAAAGKNDEAVDAFKSAESRFAGVSAHEDETVALAAAYARANALTEQARMIPAQEKYQEAIAALRSAEQAYAEVLKRKPDYTPARRNLDHVRLLLKQLLQNPPENQEPPEQQEQEQQQDKQPPPQIFSIVRGATTELPGANANVNGNTVTLQPGASP